MSRIKIKGPLYRWAPEPAQKHAQGKMYFPGLKHIYTEGIIFQDIIVASRRFSLKVATRARYSFLSVENTVSFVKKVSLRN